MSGRPYARPLLLALALAVLVGGAATVAARQGDGAATRTDVGSVTGARSLPTPAASPSRPAAPAPPPIAGMGAPVPTVRPAAEVRPLTALVVPDLLVTQARTVTAAQLAALRRIPGLTSVVPLAVGRVVLPGGGVTAIGGDPSLVRTVTPAPTAGSDPLWASVARGDLLTTFAVSRAQHLHLGATVAADARPVRLGSIADLRLPGVGALADPALAAALHLTPDAGLVVTAPTRDVVGLDHDVRAVLGGRPSVSYLRPFVPAVSGGATLSVPLYRAAAATCPGLPWTVLAAIGGIESDHGADTATSPAGARGPMQFLPGTFAAVAVDGDHDGRTVITDPADAVFSAARLLCDDGAGRGGASLHAAIFRYNHAEWYVDAVLQLAARYAAA